MRGVKCPRPREQHVMCRISEAHNSTAVAGTDDGYWVEHIGEKPCLQPSTWKEEIVQFTTRVLLLVTINTQGI